MDSGGIGHETNQPRTLSDAPSTGQGRTDLRVFISYRREDTADAAGRLYDTLGDRFGAEVFMDIDTIEPGVDFVEVVNGAVGTCDVLLVLIGRQWVAAADARGERRLDKPDDLVRLEVEAALDRDVRVIPILLQHADMPAAHELPDSLSRLTRRNAIELSTSRWQFDVGRLTDALSRIATSKQAERERADRLAQEQAERERAEAAPKEAERERVEATPTEAERERVEATPRETPALSGGALAVVLSAMALLTLGLVLPTPDGIVLRLISYGSPTSLAEPLSVPIAVLIVLLAARSGRLPVQVAGWIWFGLGLQSLLSTISLYGVTVAAPPRATALLILVVGSLALLGGGILAQRAAASTILSRPQDRSPAGTLDAFLAGVGAVFLVAATFLPIVRFEGNGYALVGRNYFGSATVKALLVLEPAGIAIAVAMVGVGILRRAMAPSASAGMLIAFGFETMLLWFGWLGFGLSALFRNAAGGTGAPAPAVFIGLAAGAAILVAGLRVHSRRRARAMGSTLPKDQFQDEHPS